MNNYVSLLSSFETCTDSSKVLHSRALPETTIIFIVVEKAICSVAYINANLAKTEARIHFGKSTSHSSCITESMFYMTDLVFYHEPWGAKPKVTSTFERTLYSHTNTSIKNLAITEREIFKYLTEIKLISLSNLWIVP